MARKLRSKKDVVKVTTIFKGEKKNGKSKKYGVVVEFNDGKATTLLNPSGKAEKYANELKDGVRVTNDGLIKRDKSDYPLELNNCQRSYRRGYLAAQKDNAKAYNAKQAQKGAKKSGGK